jgi:hypothetical protein
MLKIIVIIILSIPTLIGVFVLAVLVWLLCSSVWDGIRSWREERRVLRHAVGSRCPCCTAPMERAAVESAIVADRHPLQTMFPVNKRRDLKAECLGCGQTIYFYTDELVWDRRSRFGSKPQRILRRPLEAPYLLLRHILRNAPECIDLTLDPDGWVDITKCRHKMAQTGFLLTEEVLLEIVERNPKMSFQLSEDGRRIRARHMHDTVKMKRPAEDHQPRVNAKS